MNLKIVEIILSKALLKGSISMFLTELVALFQLCDQTCHERQRFSVTQLYGIFNEC